MSSSALFARPQELLAGAALLCVAAVAAALVSQHVFGMEPCPWCVLQRLIFVAIAAACVIGLLWRTTAGRALAGVLALLLALSGVAAALWQHFVASKSQSCNLTLADRIVSGLRLDTALPDVFSPRASCADAMVNLLGVPYDIWSLALFVVMALVSLRILMRAKAR